MRASLAVPTRSLHWLCEERSGVNDSAGGGAETRSERPGAETDAGARDRRTATEVQRSTSGRGETDLKGERKRTGDGHSQRPTHRRSEAKRWWSEPSSQPGRGRPLTLNWAKGVQPTGLWGRGVPALLGNVPKGSAGIHLSINQRIYTKLEVQLVRK